MFQLFRNSNFDGSGTICAILHEHEIRRAEAPFVFLGNKDKKWRFMRELTQKIIDECPMVVVASAIRKDILTSSDRLRLEAVASNRNTAQKHVWRAAIVLLSADGLGTTEIMRRTGTSKTCVWRWQERFMQEGVDGLLRDKTRPSRIKPLGPDIAERVVTPDAG